MPRKLPEVTECLRAEVRKWVEAGGSLNQLSEKSDVDWAALSRFHNNPDRKPNGRTIDLLANFFGLELKPVRKAVQPVRKGNRKAV